MTTADQTLRLGTRGSLLARAQSGWVATELERRNPGLKVELVVVSTTGDRITDQPLHAFGGKGLFTKELELALLQGTVDFAVHSFKDVPVTMPLVDNTDLVIAAVPPREDPRDCWIGPPLSGLPKGAVVGTGSLRRRCQILAARPDVRVESIRGNIDTRLRKCRDGAYAAIVLATAGLKRAGLFDPAAMTPIDADRMIPAPGQGALALQCRRDRSGCREVLQTLHDSATATAVAVERKLVELLNGDCHSPIAAFAEVEGQGLRLRAAVGARDGNPPLSRAVSSLCLNDPGDAAVQIMRVLERDGAVERLKAG